MDALVSILKRTIYRARRKIYISNIKRLEVKREIFLLDLKTAIKNQQGFAAGKIGVSDEYWLYYPILLEKKKSKEIVSDFEKRLSSIFYNQAGLFPAGKSFFLEYAGFYANQIKDFDYYGIMYANYLLKILKYYQFKSPIVYYLDQEPDRSTPSIENNCYLPFFEGKNILLVSSYADLLRERATKEIFEAVWKNIGKRWFYPKSVQSLEFPFGYSSEAKQRFKNAISMYKEIAKKIDSIDFDIALIAGGGLGNPIAAYVKRVGKIGINLGGHLQVLFGVYGKRWIEMTNWFAKYFNRDWIRMPEQYRPDELDKGIKIADDGAFW